MLDTENADANYNNIIFTIKDTQLCLCHLFIDKRQTKNQKLLNILSKGFHRSVYWNDYKTKCETKNTTNEYKHFLKSNFVGVIRLFVFIYSNEDNKTNRYKAQRYYLGHVQFKVHS